jgi:hypothetical protein
MFRTRQLGGAVFSLTLTLPSQRHVDEEPIETGVLYIGLGDQFDDDRRLVREAKTGQAKAGAIGARGLRRL